MPNKSLPIVISVFGALAVILGAFGSHGLKETLSPDRMGIYETGIQYHFYHVLAALGAYLASFRLHAEWSRNACVLFLIGICLFSGSLYLLACRDLIKIPVAIVGPLTPVGGVFFILGWISLIIATIKTKSS